MCRSATEPGGSPRRAAQWRLARLVVGVSLTVVSVTLTARSPASAQARFRINAGAGLSTAYDSNLDHSAAAVPGMSLAGNADLELRYTGSRAGLQLGYVAGYFRYEGAPERNRTTHHARGVLSLTPSSHLVLSATLETSIGGLSEDREVGTEYGVTPRVEIRPDRRNRLRLHTLHRVRRFGPLSGNDVVNHGAGVDYRIGESGEPNLELGTRYDQTITEDERSRFNRWTQRVTFTAPLSATASLTLGARQITRTYPNRLVALEPLSDLELLPEELRIIEGYTDSGAPGTNPFAFIPADVLLRWRDLPRRDEIWAPTAGVTVRALGLDLRFSYNLEMRLSNDLRRGYTAHAVTIDSRWRLR